MDPKPVGNFPILRVQADDPIVHLVHDDTTVYVAVECANQSLNVLHGIMRQVQAHNSWMPNFLPPTHYQQTHIPYLAVECFNRLPLLSLAANWFFIKATVSYSHISRQWNTVFLYLTLPFKKLIWSILRTVFAFTDTNIRPILDSATMFVSKDNNVIFSRFQVRDNGIHDRNFEAREITRLLKALLSSKAKTSDTLKAEFAQLCTWLVSSTSPFGAQPQNGKLPPLKNALKNVVFWDCRMRINYLQLLGDFVIRDTISIFPVAERAFAQGNNTNWRKVMEMQKNAVLTKVLQIGDMYYNEKLVEYNSGSTLKKPSFLRKRDISTYTPKDILRSGVVRIRDSFYHFYKEKEDMIQYYGKNDITDEDLQGMYQYIYPCHMVELAEMQVQEQTKFNAIDIILGSFAQTQVEDVSARLPKIIDLITRKVLAL